MYVRAVLPAMVGESDLLRLCRSVFRLFVTEHDPDSTRQ